jgi:hypothetical protein
LHGRYGANGPSTVYPALDALLDTGLAGTLQHGLTANELASLAIDAALLASHTCLTAALSSGVRSSIRSVGKFDLPSRASLSNQPPPWRFSNFGWRVTTQWGGSELAAGAKEFGGL